MPPSPTHPTGEAVDLCDPPLWIFSWQGRDIVFGKYIDPFARVCRGCGQSGAQCEGMNSPN